MIETFVVMALMIVLGVLVSIKDKASLRTRKVFGNILVYLAIPSVVLEGILRLEEVETVLGALTRVFFLSLVVSCCGIGIAWLFCRFMRKNEADRRSIAVLGGLGNTGFLGITLAAAIYGPVAGLYAAVFDIGATLVIFTLALFMLQGGDRLSVGQALKAVCNVPVLIMILGMGLKLGGAELPGVAASLVERLSGLAMPLGMLYIGLMLPSLFARRHRGSASGDILLSSTVKLVIFPVLVLLMLVMSDMPEVMKQVLLLQAATPTFILAPVLFGRYARSYETVAVQTTMFSTIVAMVTMPVLLYCSIVIL